MTREHTGAYHLGTQEVSPGAVNRWRKVDRKPDDRHQCQDDRCDVGNHDRAEVCRVPIARAETPLDESLESIHAGLTVPLSGPTEQSQLGLGNERWQRPVVAIGRYRSVCQLIGRRRVDGIMISEMAISDSQSATYPLAKSCDEACRQSNLLRDGA